MQVLFPLMMDRDQRRYFVAGAIVCIFCFLALMIAIPSIIDRPYYGNTGYVHHHYHGVRTPPLIIAHPHELGNKVMVLDHKP